MQRHDLVGQGVRTHGPRSAWRLPLGRSPLADPMPHLRGIETHQRPQGFSAEPQRRQRMHALDPQQGFQPIEQEVWHDRHHLALTRRALDAFHQVEHSQLPQQVEEVIQHGPCVPLRHAVDHLLAVQAPRHARVIAVRRLPTQAFRQVLRARFPSPFQEPPSSLACPSAIEERGPPIKGFAYLGTSVHSSHDLTL